MGVDKFENFSAKHLLFLLFTLERALLTFAPTINHVQANYLLTLFTSCL